jgi:hypothetical protein
MASSFLLNTNELKKLDSCFRGNDEGNETNFGIRTLDVLKRIDTLGPRQAIAAQMSQPSASRWLTRTIALTQ